MSTVAEAMRGCSALLLDFDGPVCDVFACHPAPVVSGELRRYLAGEGIESPADLHRDPLKILQWVGTAHPDLLRPVEDLLVAEEKRAAESSAPTPGAREVIEAATRSGWPVAIVSNNSAAAIEVYLAAHGLADSVAQVIGRLYGQPERMKPRPDMVQLAVERLNVAAGSCVLVGDSPSDMQASTAAGTRPIGYAKTPERRAGLLAADAAAVVDDMRELLAAWAIA